MVSTCVVTGVSLAYLNAKAEGVQNTFAAAGEKLVETNGAFVLKEHALVYGASGLNPKDGTPGSYTLGDTKEVNENTYPVLPGLTFPKDPFVRIDPAGKTAAPAYVYIEVAGSLEAPGTESTLQSGLHMLGEVDGANWQLLDGVNGPHSYDRTITDTDGATETITFNTKVYQLYVGGSPVRVFKNEQGELIYQTVSDAAVGQETPFESSGSITVDAQGRVTLRILKDNKLRIAAVPFSLADTDGDDLSHGYEINRTQYSLTFYGYMVQAYNTDAADCYTKAFPRGSLYNKRPVSEEGGGRDDGMADEMI